MNIIKPSAKADAEHEIDDFISNWKLLATQSKELRYYVYTTKTYNRLMNTYGEVCTDLESRLFVLCVMLRVQQYVLLHGGLKPMFDNNKLGEIRPNQLITTFGPGSIVDAVKDSVTVLDLNYWKEKGKKIIDGRLASYLGVDCFLYATDFL